VAPSSAAAPLATSATRRMSVKTRMLFHLVEGEAEQRPGCVVASKTHAGKTSGAAPRFRPTSTVC
jgi:hypothetical protein